MYKTMKLKKNQKKSDKDTVEPVYVLNLLPHSECEIRWASQEAGCKLDNSILCAGPLRIEIYTD
jgi:hypothetical protein|nr:MAG TPA: hypothetical protein [Caudoviricetes sp.]